MICDRRVILLMAAGVSVAPLRVVALPAILSPCASRPRVTISFSYRFFLSPPHIFDIFSIFYGFFCFKFVNFFFQLNVTGTVGDGGLSDRIPGPSSA